jgi:hypothetical protein
MPASPDVVVLEERQKIFGLSANWVLGPVWCGEGRPVELTVAFPPYTYRLLIEVGTQVWMDDTFLTVTKADPARVEVRWSNGQHEPTRGILTTDPIPAKGGSVYVLPEQGFYRLADGKVLGVGNIGVFAPYGFSVGFECFPTNFERNYAQAHDRDVRLAKDGVLVGPLCRGKVIDLKAGDATRRGEVTLFVGDLDR